jgi:RND superfamily putative drug exporter
VNSVCFRNAVQPLIGVGLVTVVVDATLVRALLVPAIRLLGRANWWLPGPLRRLHARVELSEGEDHPAAEEPSRAEAPV